MPDHLMGLLLLVGTTKERERQDCNRHPDRSPYGNPTFLVLRTPTLCLMAVFTVQSGLREIGTGVRCPRPLP